MVLMLRKWVAQTFLSVRFWGGFRKGGRGRAKRVPGRAKSVGSLRSTTATQTRVLSQSLMRRKWVAQTFLSVRFMEFGTDRIVCATFKSS